MFRNFKIRHKLVLLGALLSLPAFILLFFFVREKDKSIAFAQQERAGNYYSRPLRKILETIPQFERGGLADTAARVDEAFAELSAQTEQNGENFGTTEKFNELRKSWQELKINRPNTAPEVHQELYRRAMQNTLEMFSLVGYSSHLVLDQDVAGFYMADAMLVRLPEQVKLMSEITQLGDRIVMNKAATPDEKLQMNIWLNLLEANAADIRADYDQAVRRGNAEELRAFEATLKKHSVQLEIFGGMLRQKILQGSAEDFQYISTSHFNTTAGNAVTSGANLWRDIAESNEILLARRISSSTFEKFAALGAVLLVGLLAGLFAWLTVKKCTGSLDEAVEISERVSRGEIVTVVAGTRGDEVGKLMDAMARMTAYLQEMAETSDQIAGGNLSVEVEPKSDADRFGNSFQNMITRTLRLVQSQEERDRLQNSIMKLLRDVSDVASGDLRAQAEVTPDMTGAIADAFNFMIEELRSIISQVQTTTREVDSSAERVQTATEDLVTRSEMQSAQLA
ncbi:MAG TPA: methyl-accepting chemotaxis protein [Pyrinomonadaceae bacterium]|nr:methyl-accepting chemotaxis protein [Pyrinomonadaceae bacterium]